MKHLVNQDHDFIIIQTQPLYAAPIISRGKYLGHGIYHGDILLGSFDGDQEAIEELVRIESTEAAYVIVDDYDTCDDEALNELIELVNRDEEAC